MIEQPQPCKCLGGYCHRRWCIERADKWVVKREEPPKRSQRTVRVWRPDHEQG